MVEVSGSTPLGPTNTACSTLFQTHPAAVLTQSIPSLAPKSIIVVHRRRLRLPDFPISRFPDFPISRSVG